MAENLIHSRVADFLIKWPPFDKVSNEGLAILSRELSIQFFESGKKVFESGQQAGDFIYVVRQGSIRIISPSGELFDVCDEGDIFGVRAILAEDEYKADAIAEENSLLYCIPTKLLKNILKTENNLALYFTSGFAAGVPIKGTPFRAAGGTIIADQNLNFRPDALIIDGRKSVISCMPESTIKEAAILMSSAGVGSIIVCNEKKHPIGILTDKDLRTKIGTGFRSIEDPVKLIASSPVVCSLPGLTYSEYLIKMLQNGVHHLCITSSGDDNSPAEGMLTEHDLLLEQGNNPAVIFREMSQAKDWETLRDLRIKAQFLLKRYINQKIPVQSVCEISSLLNDLLLKKLIQFSMEKGENRGKYAWLSLGSQGRREQVLFTDQDHALIVEKAEDKALFLGLAERIADLLEKAGFEKDPAGIMASNPKWCLSLEEWKMLFDQWISTPEPKAVLNSTIFFDFRVSEGDTELGEKLRSFLNERLKNADIFKVLIAKDALKTPAPLSFFRNLVLEKDGFYKDQFDLKLRAQLPLVDCARLLALDSGLTEVNTIKRLEQLAESDSSNKTILEEAAEAYNYLLNLRFENGFLNSDSGRYIQPDSLTKSDRQKLKRVFSVISDLQQIVKIRYKTGIVP